MPFAVAISGLKNARRHNANAPGILSCKTIDFKQLNALYIPLFNETVQADKIYYSRGQPTTLQFTHKLLTTSTSNNRTLAGTYSLL